MERFRTSYESVDCECGGRHNNVPATRQIHYETKKHRNWRWRVLCTAFINPDLTRGEKVMMLKEMKALVPFVK